MDDTLLDQCPQPQRVRLKIECDEESARPAVPYTEKDPKPQKPSVAAFLSQFAFKTRGRADPIRDQTRAHERVEAATSANARQPSAVARTKYALPTKDHLPSTAAEVTATVKKWTAFCDQSCTLDVQRYQVLMAAQLSTMANPKVVHDAIDGIRRHLGGSITPGAMRDIGYETLKTLVQRVHHNKQKARYIIEGAVLLGRAYKDKVPLRRQSLQQFKGIGTQFSDILELVFKSKSDWPPHLGNVCSTHPTTQDSIGATHVCCATAMGLSAAAAPSPIDTSTACPTTHEQ
eukprot:m.312611 g.312611  ORF g.312611 m.312611 type:complete len:289 (+) comp20243_c0_seq3:229-1095(+)